MTWIGQAAQSGNILYYDSVTGGDDDSELVGDVSGILLSASVTAIRGISVTSNAPAVGQALVYNGTEYVPSGVGAGSSEHALLSSTHNDTVANAVTRGSIIYGNATPAWDELVLGSTGFVLYSDGTDLAYTQLGSVTPFSAGTSAAPSVTFTGDTDTGFSAQVANTLVGSAAGSGLLKLDGTNLRTQFIGGQTYHAEIFPGSATLTAADHIVLVSSTPATITLPAAPTLGQIYYIKDSGGNATGGSRITIAGNGNNIDGNTSITISNAYGAFTVLYNGSQWNVL